MNSLQDQKTKLVDEINAGLDQTEGPLAPVLRKAIRLAKLCQDSEHQFLFELHLDGASEVGGIRVQRWPDQNIKPEWDFIKAFSEDRAAEDGQINGHPVERLESLIREMKDVRARAAYLSPFLQSRI